VTTTTTTDRPHERTPNEQMNEPTATAVGWLAGWLAVSE